MEVYLVRHMQTTWNALGKLQGVTDIELSEKGKEDADRFVEVIDLKNIDAIFSSDKLRTKYLAEKLASKYSLELQIAKDLHEVNVGDWAGLTWPQIEVEYKEFLVDWFKDSENIAMPNGESYAMLLKRVKRALLNIKDKGNERIIVVTHGAVIRTLICDVLGVDLKNRSRFDVDNGSITKIEYHEEKFRLCYMNHSLDLN